MIKLNRRNLAASFAACLNLERYTGVAAAIFFGFVASGGALAQDEADGEVFELSPFEVSANDDRGYEAQNTLSGTRLNTAVKDLGISSTTLTEQFWEDTAFTSTNDMIIFTPGAEKEDTQAGAGNSRTQFWGDNTMFRGVHTENIVRNYFRTNLPSDTYNASRFEFSRGPNAVLFGVTREPAGVVNRTTKDAIFAEENEYSLRLDEHGSVRHTLNLNRELIEGKLAARAALLKDDAELWIEPGFQDQTRKYLAINYQATERLNVKARLEDLEWERAAIDPSLHFDSVTAWINSGKPAVTTGAADEDVVFPEGTRNFSGGNRYVMVNGANGVIQQNWRNHAVGNNQQLLGGGGAPLPLDFAPLDFNIFGQAGSQFFEGDNAQMEVNFKVNEKINLNYAVNSEYVLYDFIANWGSNRLFVDANATLDDGATPNPNFGDYFSIADTNWRLKQDRYLRGHRLMANFSHDFAENDGKAWLGKHDFVTLLETNTDEFYWDVQRLINTTPQPGVGPGDGDNFARVVNYVDLETRTITGPTNSRGFQEQLNALPGNNYQWLNGTGGGNTINRTEIDSFLFVWQSRFWDGRIIPTLGWREDKIEQFDTAPIPFARATAREQGYIRNDMASGISPDTVTRSLVFHAIEGKGPLDYLSFFYNEGNSFAVSNFNLLVDGTTPPAKTGETNDFGFRFGLMDGKLSGSFTKFDMTVNNFTTNQGMGPITSRMGDLFNMIGRPELDDLAQLARLQDLSSKGWEFQVTANIRKNWRAIFGFDHYATVDTNVAPVVRRLIEENRSAWLADPNRIVPDRDVDDTAQIVYDELVQNLNLVLAQAGGHKNNERQYKATLLTTYDVAEGPLAGFSFGGSVVWRDKPSTGFPLRSDPELGLIQDVDNPFYGTDIFNVGMHASYKRKFMDDRVDWKIQLNINNIGDEDPFVTGNNVIASDPRTPIVSSMSRGNPQTFVLTNTFSW